MMQPAQVLRGGRSFSLVLPAGSAACVLESLKGAGV